MQIYLVLAEDGCMRACSTRQLAEAAITVLNQQFPPAEVNGKPTLWIEEFTLDADGN